MPVWALGSFLRLVRNFGIEHCAKTLSLNARVGFGVFSTSTLYSWQPRGCQVSMPVWALGSFLPDDELDRLPVGEAERVSQCPCGLWGLFYGYRQGRWCPDRAGRVSMPVWALGSFLLEKVLSSKDLAGAKVSMPVWALGSFLRPGWRLCYCPGTRSQCPCGLWGLFYQDR